MRGVRPGSRGWRPRRWRWPGVRPPRRRGLPVRALSSVGVPGSGLPAVTASIRRALSFSAAASRSACASIWASSAFDQAVPGGVVGGDELLDCGRPLEAFGDGEVVGGLEGHVVLSCLVDNHCIGLFLLVPASDVPGSLRGAYASRRGSWGSLVLGRPVRAPSGCSGCRSMGTVESSGWGRRRLPLRSRRGISRCPLLDGVLGAEEAIGEVLEVSPVDADAVWTPISMHWTHTDSALMRPLRCGGLGGRREGCSSRL